MSTHENSPARRSLTWPQLTAAAVGAVYTVIGLVGYAITGFSDWTGMNGDTLLGFMINPLHNLVHLVVGLLGLALARNLAGARTYGWVLAIGYGAAFVYGLFAVDRSWDVLALNWADNWLHLVTALVGLVVATAPVRAAARRRDTHV